MIGLIYPRHTSIQSISIVHSAAVKSIIKNEPVQLVDVNVKVFVLLTVLLLRRWLILALDSDLLVATLVALWLLLFIFVELEKFLDSRVLLHRRG